MGWERRGGRSYYYAKERRGGRVVSRYLGAAGWVDDVAVIVEWDTLARREEWARERAAIAKAERSTAAAWEALVELDRLTDAAVRAALTEAGFRQHHRGEWRRRRDGGEAAA